MLKFRKMLGRYFLHYKLFIIVKLIIAIYIDNKEAYIKAILLSYKINCYVIIHKYVLK